MATFLQLSDLPQQESVHLVLTIVGAGCSLVFAIVGWLLRLAINRAISKLDALTNAQTEQDRFNEWVKGVLAASGLIPKPLPPN